MSVYKNCESSAPIFQTPAIPTTHIWNPKYLVLRDKNTYSNSRVRFSQLSWKIISHFLEFESKFSMF